MSETLPQPPELCVIVPVYNEEQVIASVLEAWCGMLSGLGVDYRVHVYNDGSKDDSLRVLRQAAAELPCVVVHDKPNSGHGPTILRGYRELSDAPWLFQMDSDNELPPEPFAEFWRRREEYDLLIGRRKGSRGSLARQGISGVSAMVVRLFYGPGVPDANIPYRLMRGAAFRDLFATIPADTFAPNIIVSGHAAKQGLRIWCGEVPFRKRETGTVSIVGWKLLRNVVKSFVQVIHFRLSHY